MREPTGRRRHVLLAALGPARRLALEAVAGRRGLEVVRQCDDLQELRAAATAGVGDVAVVCSELPGLSRGVVAGVREVGVPTVGIAASAQGRLRLRRLGVDRVVDAAATPGEVADALLAAAGASGSGGVDSADISRLDAPGAVGASEVAPRDAPGPGTRAGAEDAAGHGPGATPAVAPDEAGAGWREVGLDDLAVLLDPRPGIVVAVWGPTGAPGRTTIAVTLAACAAARGATVLLVDADPYGGAVAPHVGLLAEGSALSRAVAEADAGLLDAAGLRRLVTSVAPGFDVLTGVPSARRWPELRPAGLEAVLDLARDAADLVVVDTGFAVEDDEELSYDSFAPRRNGATLTALRRADRVVVVGRADPVGLPRLAEAMAELTAATEEFSGPAVGAPAHVVVNRVRESVHGPDAARAVPSELGPFVPSAARVHVVPDDPDAVDTALRLARPLPESAPHSPTTRAVEHLLDALDPPAVPGPPGGATMTTCPID